jgi:hypothetical protein
MDLKVLVGTITIATTGLTTCNNTGGSVDPPPSPLVCNDAGGGTVSATASLSGSTLTVTVTFLGNGSWIGKPTVTDVAGAKLVSVTAEPQSNQLPVELDVTSMPATGSFTLHGQVSDGTTTCALERTFTFSTSDGGGIEVSELDRTLPLRVGVPAAIVLTSREGRAVRLAPRGAGAGSRVTWTATAGHVAVHGDGGATWTLPAEPGLYQVELLVERDDVLALDTLALEVT